MTYSPNNDLYYVEESVASLKVYLISDVLFWPLRFRAEPGNGNGYTPQELTLGNLLLAVEKLRAVQATDLMTPAQQQRFADFLVEISQLHEHWQTAWGFKADREFQARLRQWSHYLGDLSRNQGLHRPYYRTEVRNRVLLELLETYASEAVDPERRALTQLDNQLVVYLQQDEFIWPDALESQFPQERYWFLYRSIGGSQVDREGAGKRQERNRGAR